MYYSSVGRGIVHVVQQTDVDGEGGDVNDNEVGDVNENWDVTVEYEQVDVGEVAASASSRGQRSQRETNLTSECLVCGGKAAAHQHYGAVCCYSCRAFFRRGISRAYTCVRGDRSCQINSITRTNCKKCRFDRCLGVGMRPELVDATLRRKQEEVRRQEVMEMMDTLDHSEVLETENQSVNGIIQLHQAAVHARNVAAASAQLQSQQVLQAVQGLQQPIPRHMLQAPQTPAPKRSDNVISPGSGKKKVLLELRQNENERTEPPRTPNGQLMHVQSQTPVRQQTYYIFHPMSQTFEPITFAEFSEGEIVEEVVVGQDDEKYEEVVNAHDYIEVKEHVPAICDNPVEQILGNIPSPQLVKKPVISPVVKQPRKRKLVQETPALNLVHADAQIKPAKTSVIKKLTNELIEETILENSTFTDDLKPSGNEMKNEDVTNENVNNNVNIEDLVDVCFEEELLHKNVFEEENLTEMGGKFLTSKKRKTEAVECSSLPPKKRHQMKILEPDYNYSLVSYFSHKILEFELTIEEKLQINFLLLASEKKKFIAPNMSDIFQLKLFNNFTSDALVLVQNEVKTMALFKYLFYQKKISFARGKVRNTKILLFRYLSSFKPVTYAAQLAHHLIGLIETEKS